MAESVRFADVHSKSGFNCDAESISCSSVADCFNNGLRPRLGSFIPRRSEAIRLASFGVYAEISTYLAGLKDARFSSESMSYGRSGSRRLKRKNRFAFGT